MNNHALGRIVATIGRALGFIFRHARSERGSVHDAFRPRFQSVFGMVPAELGQAINDLRDTKFRAMSLDPRFA
jgi:hypothetical protein